MSQARERDLQLTQGGPVPYRPAPNLRIKMGSRDAAGSRVRFIRSPAGLTQLGEEEYFIFSALDGVSTFAKIESEFRARFAGDLSRPQFQSLIDELLEAGIIEPVGLADAKPQSVPPVAAPFPEPVAETAEWAAPSDNRSAARISPALLLCARLGAPLRHFVSLLLPATALAGAQLWTGRFLLAQTESAAASTGAGWLSLDILLAAGLVLVIPTIAKAGVATFHGVPWDALRPVGSVARSADLRIAGLPRKGVVWTYAAPLLALLVVFLAGTFLWAAQEDPKSQTAVAALVVGLGGLVAFLVGAIPLWPGPGRRFIAAYVAGASSGRGHERGFMVGASVIGAAAITGAVLLALADAHAATVEDAAGIMLASAFAGAFLWLLAARSAVGRLRPELPSTIGYARTSPGQWPQRRGAVSGGDDGTRQFSLDERLAGADDGPTDRGALKLAIIVAVVVAIAFLPYPYESGGAFTVMPYGRSVLPARVSGELTEILIREGEWVNEGQVVATLSDWTEQHSLNLAQAELEQASAKLQNLLISPKPEEVEVAKRQYDLALARLPYSKTDFERKLALVKTQDISVQQFQLALSTYQQDLAAVDITRANYDLVRVGPTTAQIAEARAAVQQETEQIAYWRDQLARTRIHATVAGQVVTPDPQLLLGKFLQEGAPFIQLEDHRVAHVEVLVPETDIRDIHLGSAVRVRAWGYEQITWPGKVTLIAPDAQPNQPSGGNVVRVVAEVANPEGKLRPDMSGYAKVETVYFPLWYAYMRSIVRFLRIEIWSWVP